MDGAPAGSRRLDRVLASDFLDGLAEAPLADLRAMRAEVEQEEVDLSFIRRLVQGRLDLVQAELDRRSGAVQSSGDLVADLTRVLTDARPATAHGLGRHAVVEPSRADSHRRYVEALVADVDLSDVAARTDDELRRACEALSAEEESLSSKRRAVQSVMDALSAEVTRRYRDGEADVDALLPGE